MTNCYLLKEILNPDEDLAINYNNDKQAKTKINVTEF